MRNWLFSLALLPCTAFAVNVSFTLTVNPDGTYDTAFPTGNKAPGSSTLLWTVSNLSSYEGLISAVGTTEDVRAAALSGTAAATATIAVNYNSGTALATAGIQMNVDGDTLEIDCDATGSGSFYLSATESGNIANSAAISWSCVTAPTGDTTAPTVPTGVTTAGGTNQVVVSWESAADVYDGEACSGMKHYLLRDSGSPLATVTTGVSLGPCPEFTQTLIGGTDGSPSNTQTGVDWDITGAGDGLDDTTDQFNFINASWTGDFVAHVTVDSTTTAAGFAKYGLHARTGTAVGAPYVQCGYMENGRRQLIQRAVTDGSVGTSLNEVRSLPLTFRLTRSGNTFSCDTSTNNGVTWTGGASTVVSMPDNILVGLAVTGEVAGTNATGNFSEFGISNVGTISYTHSTASGGSYTVAAVDQDDNTSTYTTPAVAGSPAGAAAGKKWTPGWYVKGQGNHCNSNIQAHWDGLEANRVAHLGSSSEFEGMQIHIAWGALETDNGVYDWTQLDQYLARLDADGKKLLLFVEYKCYNGTPSVDTLMPADLESEAVDNASSKIARVWDAAVMDRFIAFNEALAARYEDDATLEMVGASENCPTWGGNAPADYTTSAYATQLERLAIAAGAAYQKTNYVSPANCTLGGLSPDWAQAGYNVGVGLASPDAHDDLMQQLTDGTVGGVDYRGTIPLNGVLSIPNLGGKDDILPLSNAQTIIESGGKTHVSLVMTSTATGGTKSDIISHIEAGGGATNNTVETCPSQYTALGLGGCQ